MQINEHRKIDDLLRHWEDRILKQSQLFDNFSNQVVQVDTAIISNNAKFKVLSDEYEDLKTKQDTVEHSIKGIAEQQEALGRLLGSVQEALDAKHPQISESTKVHQKANALSVQLDDLDRQVELLTEEINVLHDRQLPKPISEIASVLNTHSKTLDVMQAQTEDLTARLNRFG